MKKILEVILLLLPMTAQSEWAIGTGWDGRHDQGRNYTELRYIDTELFFEDKWYEFGWQAFLGTDETIGLEMYFPLKNWELGWGVEHSTFEEDIVETEWKYQIRIGYNFTDQLSAQLWHKSNCRDICTKVPGLSILPHGNDTQSNRGLNYVGLQYRWK